MNTINDSLPSGLQFKLDLNLNHPSLLPGVQVVTESTLFQGGKLFRPRLCFMMAEAVGLSLEKVGPFARIAELVHAATLAHDDVIDDATERRNKITLNAKTSQARAVLAGDLMLSRAMVELCKLGNHKILNRMSEVLEDLVTGEWLQLENRGVLSISPHSLNSIASYKTASMLEWCAEIPLLVYEAPIDSIYHARKFGHSLGIAFQWIDDCIDFGSNSGKSFCKDLSEGLLNQVTFILLQNQPSLDRYFQSIMNHETNLDQKTFRQTVGDSQLKAALNEVRERSHLEINLAKDSLTKLNAEMGKHIKLDHLNELLVQLSKREI